MARRNENTISREPVERIEDWYDKVSIVLQLMGVRIPSLPTWVPDPDFRRQGFLMPIALTALAFAALMAGYWAFGLK